MLPSSSCAPFICSTPTRRPRLLRVALTLVVLGTSSTLAQSTRYGDALLQVQTDPITGERERSALLTSSDGVLGLYVFCVDSRTPNVSLFLIDGTFEKWGYDVGARIPVTWRADSRSSVQEYWRVIGRGDDLRRYGKLGLVTAELFKTQRQFLAQLFDKKYTFPASGINTAMKQLPCVVPFLKSTGYLK